MRRAWLAAIVFAACRTAAPPATPPPPAEKPVHGDVSKMLLADPSAREVALLDGEDYRHPFLHAGNIQPQYPPDLVPLRLEPQTVAVRLVIDEEGAAESIGPSPLRASSGGPHHAAFEEAVRSALLTWKGEPAHIRHFVPGPDSDGDGKPDFDRMDRDQPIKAYFDIVFVFEVKDGAAVVRTAEP